MNTKTKLFQYLLLIFFAILVKALNYALLPLILFVYQLFKTFPQHAHITVKRRTIRGNVIDELSTSVTSRFDLVLASIGCLILIRIGAVASPASISVLASFLLTIMYIRLEINLDIVIRITMVLTALIAILYSPHNLTTVENLSIILFFHLGYISLAMIKSSLTTNNT